MDLENDNFSTPQRKKRLGLRRSSSTLNNSIKQSAGFAKDCKGVASENPLFSPRTRLQQSDVKINYKELEQSNRNKSTARNETIPGTPKNTISTELQRLAITTNCRPYRLALSKNVRERMTKKRLEFYLANEMEKEETVEKQIKKDVETDEEVDEGTLSSREELLQQIEIARKEVASREAHMRKVEELQQAIAVWKAGFSSALHDLQQKIEPRLETATLLECLHIPQEMIKYISD